MIKYIENKSIKFVNKLLSFMKKNIITNEIIERNKIISKIFLKSEEIHLCLGPDVIKNNKGIKNGAKIKLQYGGPTDIWAPVKVSRKTGYNVPIRTTARKKIINQLFSKIKNSFEKILQFLFSDGAYLKKINIDEKTITNKNDRINRPLFGSLANV